jgi:hypothetical protein
VTHECEFVFGTNEKTAELKQKEKAESAQDSAAREERQI